MFDIAPSELMLVAAVALVVIGPKDLPRALHFVGRWVGRARGMARHFRSGLDEIMRQAELEEMERKWAAENARIMAEHPAPPPEEAHDAAFAAAPPDDPQFRSMIAASTAPAPALPPAGDPVSAAPSPAAPPGSAAAHGGDERDDRG